MNTHDKIITRIGLTLFFVMALLALLANAQFGGFVHDQPFLAADDGEVEASLWQSKLWLWWDGSDLADGDVSEWTNKLTGLALKAPAAANKPTAASGWVTFDGVDDMLTNTIAITSTNWAVSWILTNVVNEAYGVMNAGTTEQDAFWISSMRLTSLNAGTPSFEVQNIPANVFFYAVWNCASNDLSSSIYTNGIKATPIGGSGRVISPVTFQKFGNGSASGFSGEIAEMLFWTNVLSEAEIADFHTYVTNKYGAIP